MDPLKCTRSSCAKPRRRAGMCDVRVGSWEHTACYHVVVWGVGLRETSRLEIKKQWL